MHRDKRYHHLDSERTEAEEAFILRKREEAFYKRLERHKSSGGKHASRNSSLDNKRLS